MEKEIAIIKIQKFLKTQLFAKKCKNIYKIFIQKYFNKNIKCSKEKRLTEYEMAVGYTEETRMGSKNFCNIFGKFFEDICNNSYLYNTVTNHVSTSDGIGNNYVFECKSRHDTMKQSLAIKELEPKLKYARKNNKIFILFVLTDKNNVNRDIPLNNGFGLKEIINNSYYDIKDRWISGINVYKFLFPNFYNEIKNFILDLLSCLIKLKN